jgi:hypothetical protein
VIRREDLKPGDCFSTDLYESRCPGRRSNTKGKEKAKDKYVGGLIAVDHATSMMFINHQCSLRAGETVESKKHLERWARETAGVKIKRYHADNGVFTTNEFQTHLKDMEQTFNLCGVGAHHQNAVAERAILTVTLMARTLLLHAILHWPDETELDLWPFAMEHAVFVWNNLPNQEHGSAPIELWTGQLFENFDHLKHLHVFGCPAYVLEPTLQDGKKLPRWVARTRRGQYLGVAPDHASTVGRIRNLLTGHISPQFHVVHDDWFTTIPNANDANGPEDLETINIEAILQTTYSRDHFDVEDRDENGLPIPFPVLDDEWLTREETFERRRMRERRGHLPRNRLDTPGPPRTRGGDVQEGGKMPTTNPQMTLMSWRITTTTCKAPSILMTRPLWAT